MKIADIKKSNGIHFVAMGFIGTRCLSNHFFSPHHCKLFFERCRFQKYKIYIYRKRGNIYNSYGWFEIFEEGYVDPINGCISTKKGG